MLRTLALSVLLVVACSAPPHESSPMTPIAAYLSSDSATERAISTALDHAGISAVYVGSLGTTVNVEDRDAPKARELIGELSARGVAVTVIARNEK